METEKNSSIEVAQNAKGQYTFKVKIYFDAFPEIDKEDPTYTAIKEECLLVNSAIEETYKDLHMRFRN